MRNDNDRAPGESADNVLQDAALCLRIEGRCSLVEQEERCTPEQGSGNGDALRLSFRKARAAFAANALNAIGQFVDEVGRS